MSENVKTSEKAGASQKSFHQSTEFYRQIETGIYKPDIHPVEDGLRLYSVQYGSAWNLQIRGVLRNGGSSGGEKSKSSIIANMTLSRTDMEALRDAINDHLQDSY